MSYLKPSSKPIFYSKHPTFSPLHSRVFAPAVFTLRPFSNPRVLNLNMKALSTPQPHFQETQITKMSENREKLKIAIVGFGNFGQFLARTLVQQGHIVLAQSKSDHSEIATKLGVPFFRDANDLFEQQPEVILMCTSILSTESVLRSLPIHRLKRAKLFVDVLSVKEFPRNLFLQYLPPEFDVLCAHPMFGPESGKNGWGSLPFVYERVRIGNEDRCTRFLEIFGEEGCAMIEMSCEEHDRHVAGSQFITETMGRVLGELGLKSTPIDTKGFEALRGLVDSSFKDGFELYCGLFLYNRNAREQLERLDVAFGLLKKQLFGDSKDVMVRKQVVENSDHLKSREEPIVHALLENGYNQGLSTAIQ